jgi:uncharacterized protein YpiB (UPF0302 family)
MEDNTEITSEDTEVTVEKEQAPVSIREALRDRLDMAEELKDPNPLADEEDDDGDYAGASSEHTARHIPLAPPADMNKEEREAFLNPTAQNSHILQGYLNRRAYETRSDYSRKMQEVEAMRKETASLVDTVRRYEEEYAREGISITDVARRSVAWDKAMKANPVETALDWLDSYGLSLQDLYQQNQYQQQSAPPEYLTREEAERIAEERFNQAQEEQQKKAVELFNQRVVESFMSSKPLFRDPETALQLENEMAPVVQALTATGRYSSPEQVLETAYNYVVNGNPTFSGLVQKMAAKPVIEQQQQATQKAKQAAKSISGSTGSGTPRIHAKDLRDNLRRRMVGE